MDKKAFALKNLGMNRDMSISKIGDTNAYENYNIRILTRDKDTLLSVTNERGNVEIALGGGSISGDYLLGWNVLNENLILFLTSNNGSDYIYRIQFSETDFNPTITTLFPINGATSLGFDKLNPIESVVYYESDDIQKIYWVDGINPLRMMNFAASAAEKAKWDATYFDTNRELRFSATVNISKDNSGNPRPNGTIQYILTYFNKHGQETGYAWISDIIYLSPLNTGGAADENNNNRVTLNFTNLDTHFTNYRVYSIFRSSYDGTFVSNIVQDGEIPSNGTAVVVDDAANQVIFDTSALLYLGSQTVIPGTMAHKDNTLFLGDLTYDGRNYDVIDAAIETYMRDGSGNATCITFDYSSDMDYVENKGLYPYENQLVATSDEITTFKGNEKYRFALTFRTKHGKQTQAFWVGDATNTLYPIIDTSGATPKIKRVIAKCDIPPEVVAVLKDSTLDFDLSVIQLMIAEASYADRSVKAQGVINPTVFNLWSRYNSRLYSVPSWLTRPRNSVVANRHFDVIHNSTNSTGEIECNHWDSEDTPKPYYQYKDYLTPSQEFAYKYEGVPDSAYSMLVIKLNCSQHTLITGFRFDAVAFFVTSNVDSGYESSIESFTFTGSNVFTAPYFSASGTGYYIASKSVGYGWCGTTYDEACNAVYIGLKNQIINTLQVSEQMFVSETVFRKLCDKTQKGETNYINCKYFSNINDGTSSMKTSAEAAADYKPSSGTLADRWTTSSTASDSGVGRYVPSFYMQHLSFIDENVATLNSPELFYNATSLDNVSGCKLRIVGAAKITSNITDYTLDATHAMLPGQNLASVNFSGTSEDGLTKGLQSWPLWDEYGLTLNEEDNPDVKNKLTKDLTSADYIKGPGNTVRYWLYMWDNAGAIDNYSDENNFSYGVIKHKVFANLKFAYSTVYNSVRSNDWKSDLDSIRIFNNPSSQLLSLGIGNETVSYDGCIDELLSMPGTLKYPVTYSSRAPESNQITSSTLAFMYSNAPVPVTYDTNPHCVFSLPTIVKQDASSLNVYEQTILPHLSGETDVTIASRDIPNSITGALLPWRDSENGNNPNAAPGQNTGSVLVVGGMSLPNNFELQSFSEGGMYAAVELTDTSANISALSDTWTLCQSYAGARSVFVRIKVSCSWNSSYDNKIFLIDVANFAAYDSTHLIMPYAKVAGFDSQSSSTVKKNVEYATYTAGSPATITAGDSSLTGTPLYVSLAIGDGSTSLIAGYPYLDYKVNSTVFNLTPGTGAETIGAKDEYVFIGEIYYPFGEGGAVDTRYGDVKNNKFVVAGPQYKIADMSSSSGAHNYIIGNHGDTYFQRWDDLRVKPHSEDDVNSVVDIVSVMLETHINIDGRTDHNRETKYIASMDNANFDSINPVYSQPNNFISQRDLDVDFNQDSYGSYITWTLEKHPMEEVDEWSHITLANNLALDGDKGICRAIRRFQNTLYAFQDRSISEILFNSRTQLTTTSGTPVEIANSGKVDGKRTITNNYGCRSKWSIVEGKAALYFIDNINKAFCGFNGQAIDNISSRLGFDALFRSSNSMEIWNPKEWMNEISFYDKIHSDVYLMFWYPLDFYDRTGSLVYNENLGRFTTFLGYSDVPMMTNVLHNFVSFHKNRSGVNKLWWQNKGFFCNFFGEQDDFYMTYNVTPEPYKDKIWTNLEYRADFYTAFDSNNEESMYEFILDGGDKTGHVGNYLKDKTFDKMLVWNEYQQTEEFNASASEKKFRIWRTQIPRAIVTDTNKYGFDRIRNPWIKLFMGKKVEDDEKKNMMQLHDINVIYYE